MDGLIFQPELDVRDNSFISGKNRSEFLFQPYTPGRSPRVLKWKEDIAIDFLLKISVDSKLGYWKNC